MYYNDNDKILIDTLPNLWVKDDGSFLINFNLFDNDTLSDYGFYLIRNDNNFVRTNAKEDIDKRQIILNKPYADVIRFWFEAGE
jgi:hypothetical protein